MTELFLDQIRERNSGDKAAMAEAFDNLNRMVGKHISTEGNTTDKNQGATAHDPNNADLSRTLPERRLTVRDILVFAMKSITLRDIMFIIIACAIVTALTMLTPYLNKQIFDDVIPSGEISNVLPIAIVLAATGIGAVLFGVTRNLLLLRIRDKVDVALQAAIMSRTYRLPVDFFRNYSPGDLGGRVMSVSTLCAILSDNVLSGILTIIFSLSYLYQIFIYAQSLLPLSLLLIMANITLIIASYWVNARFNSSIQPRLTKLSGTLFSFINGIQKIKTSGSETRAFAQWVKSYQHADPNNSSKPLFIALVPVYSILINMGGTALIYTLVIQNHIALSDYIAFNVAYGEIVGAITTVSILLPSLVQIKPLFDLLKPILETVPEIEPETTKIDDLTGRIEIHDLKFRYSESTPYIIDGLSLTINPGEYIAIVGGSGSGKSTLIRLLLGFEKPESGNIFYDHYNLQKLNKRELRQKLIGTSLQDGKLFGGSIFENITVTAPFATHEEAWEAARLADIADDIEEMPMKMHTIINENGTGVSGGQRQRILIARALVCKPKILIMDEATSALDNIRQERVTNNINSTHCTRICIAHRLSTIRKCDRIIFLEKGRIAEEGTYEQLIEKKGKFYELTQRQML